MSLVLDHQTIYENSDKFELNLPVIDSLRVYHKNGSFPLIKNPDLTKKSTIVGMFVLRPRDIAWTEPVLNELSMPHESIYNIPNWAYNVKGLDGGWLISDRGTVDAYRLAFQYGISDAVMVGSRTVSEEGCNYNIIINEKEIEKSGYLWQPYEVCKWPQLYDIDNNLIQKISDQRMFLQSKGYISSRKYPAQIFVTYTGKNYPSQQFLNRNTQDFLNARAFKDRHPNGDEIEVYIISSKNGCREIRQRIAEQNHLSFLKDRIENILIDLSPEHDPNDIELTKLPSLLYSDKYKMKIVNNDGGHILMKKCFEANIIPQFNITLCRQFSLVDVVRNYFKTNNYDSADSVFETENVSMTKLAKVSDDSKVTCSTHETMYFKDNIVDIFFNTKKKIFNSKINENIICINNNHNEINHNNFKEEDNINEKKAIGNISTGIPLNFTPCQIIVDNEMSVAVVTFNTYNVSKF